MKRKLLTAALALASAMVLGSISPAFADTEVKNLDSANSVNTVQAASVQEKRLSAREARKMVIDRFGGIIEKIEYTYDETNPLYKGEALKQGQKVVFEINARTRQFVKWDTGNDNQWNEFYRDLPKFITMDEAAKKVIAQSGKKNTFVQKIDFKYDGNETIYQGEAFNRGVKYSFELYAGKGRNFKKFDTSTGDETWAKQYFNVN